MSHVLGLMTEFNLVFQSEKPLLYKVKPETEKLVKTLSSYYMKMPIIRQYGKDILKLNHVNPDFLCHLTKYI